MERLTIIGSGFCGTALAIHLLSQARQPLSLTLINRSGRFARGLAYGTRSTSHILNVPAERMSLFPDLGSDFLDFARQHLPGVNGGDFLPRSLYGDYLQDRLQRAIDGKAPQVEFTSQQRQVLDIQEDAAGQKLLLDDGSWLETERTVIATGNFAPTTPASLSDLDADPRYIRDPWREGVLEDIPATARVLLLGTGLTMYDMALALQDRGHRGPLLALSRRALLPHAHRDNTRHPELPPLPETLQRPQHLGERLAAIRAFVRDAARQGHDWRDAMAALRPITPALWQHLDDDERRRFLHHLQPYWDVHRHRAAPPVAGRIQALISRGQLQIQAGRAVGARREDGSLSVGIRPRGGRDVQHHAFDYLINCTGPCSDLRHVGEPLLTTLLDCGRIQQDANRLGLLTDGFRLLDNQGQAHSRLFLLSPMLRASHWESTAVPELRQHAQALAGVLLGD